MAKNSSDEHLTAVTRAAIDAVLLASGERLISSCLALRAALIYLEMSMQAHPNAAEILPPYCNLIDPAAEAARLWAEEIIRPVTITGKGGDA